MKKSKIIISILIIILLASFVLYKIYSLHGVKKAVIIEPSAETLINNSVDTMLNQDANIKAVETVKKESTVLKPICQNTTGYLFSCYADYYKALVKNSGTKAAINDIKQRYSTDAYLKSECHPLIHIIGSTSAAKYDTISEAYQHGDNFCWSGYYHGVLEGVVAKVGKENLKDSINNICKDIPGRKDYSFDYYNCLHGLGHGIMELYHDNLFTSLDMCSNLSGEWEQESCDSGAFMENVMIDQRGEKSDYLKPTDLLYPCDAVDQQYKKICYLMQTSYMLKITAGNFQKVFDLCANADAGFQDTCYQSLGRDASGRSISDVDITRNTCYLGKDFDQQSNCIIGAVKDFISYYHGIDKANQLCNSLTDDLKNLCLSTAKDYFSLF